MSMVRRTVVIERQAEKPVQTPPQTCPHHWLIEPAIGPTSQGVCKLCGSVKIFMNIVDDSQPKEVLNKIFDHDEDEKEGDEEEEDKDDTD
jgi:hypothetical protein